MTKLTANFLSERGAELMASFCDLNKVAKPSLFLDVNKESQFTAREKRLGSCGYYSEGAIRISIPLCARPNPQYSWPGYITDRTPFGVIQHELGHHVDWIYYKATGEWLSDKTALLAKEKRITTYAPNSAEWFAEMFRLFVTNPALLKSIRPRTYANLRKCGLRPVEVRSSMTVLRVFMASDRVIDRARKHVSATKGVRK